MSTKHNTVSLMLCFERKILLVPVETKIYYKHSEYCSHYHMTIPLASITARTDFEKFKEATLEKFVDPNVKYSQLWIEYKEALYQVREAIFFHCLTCKGEGFLRNGEGDTVECDVCNSSGVGSKDQFTYYVAPEPSPQLSLF